MNRMILGAAAALTLAGCVSTDVTPVAQNIVIISTSAAPVCGGRGAREIAFRQAAAETIRRGYDLFIIVDSASANNVGVVGYTPTTYSTNFNATGYGNSVYGNATTTAYGGSPIIGGSHDQSLAIVMFRFGDPQGVNALDAKHELGADWQAIVAAANNTCF